MHGTAAVLGISPPSTVRIVDTDGEPHDWPAHMIQVDPRAIRVINPLTERVLVTHDYSDADRNPDGTWTFTSPRWGEDFTVFAGPPQPLSMDTNGPAGEPAWP